MFLPLTLKLKSSQSGKHPQPGPLSLVRRLARCGNCDTFFALKHRWELAATYIKRLATPHWQSTDCKVAIWNLGPQTDEDLTFNLIYWDHQLFWTQFWRMAFLIRIIFFSLWSTVAFTLPYNTFLKGSRFEFESSGSGPDEPVKGIVKVVQLDPRTMAQSAFFRRGQTLRKTFSHSSRLSFPAFLAHGRPGQAPGPKAAINPLHHLNANNPAEGKKNQGVQMWQRAIDKGGKMPLPINLKDTKQTCAAVPFTQVRG